MLIDTLRRKSLFEYGP